MIDLLGLVVITKFDITAQDYVVRETYDLIGNRYNVSQHYKKKPNLTLKGYIPVNNNWHIDYVASTGIYTPALKATGAGTVGLTYKTKTTSNWNVSATIKTRRTPDIQHSSCTHGDRYNREFSCGIGGLIKPYSLMSNTTGKWQNPTITIKVGKLF